MAIKFSRNRYGIIFNMNIWPGSDMNWNEKLMGLCATMGSRIDIVSAKNLPLVVTISGAGCNPENATM